MIRRSANLYLSCRRFLSTNREVLNNLDHWISTPKQLILEDTLHPEQLSALYVTLPTRDGTRSPYQPPEHSQPLGYGHHFAFFNSRISESLLRPDGTDNVFCPPEPFTRRMWAGGKIKWNNDRPLTIGGLARLSISVDSVKKKGFERGKPMVFVNKTLELAMANESIPSVTEERVHVYLPSPAKPRTHEDATSQPVPDVSDVCDFSLTYKPTLTTLFRFSALTFNAHRIHLDKDYAVNVEGYSERLVHGPLTALMMLESAVFMRPDIVLSSFTYLARNPLIVGRHHTIYGHYTNDTTLKLWCVSEDGIVGMTGELTLRT